jgi:hypothetical protein
MSAQPPTVSVPTHTPHTHFIGALRSSVHSDPADKLIILVSIAFAQPPQSTMVGRKAWGDDTTFLFFLSIYFFYQTTTRAAMLFDQAGIQSVCRVYGKDEKPAWDTSSLRYTSFSS